MGSYNNNGNASYTYNTDTTPTRKTIKMRFNSSPAMMKKLENDPEVGTIHVDGMFIYADVGVNSPLAGDQKPKQHTVDIVYN